MKASTTSGAINSALPTGVKSCGVATGLDNELLNLIPDPRSKSHTLIGVNLSGYTHKRFSGLRSLWAIPKHTEMYMRCIQKYKYYDQFLTVLFGWHVALYENGRLIIRRSRVQSQYILMRCRDDWRVKGCENKEVQSGIVTRRSRNKYICIYNKLYIIHLIDSYQLYEFVWSLRNSSKLPFLWRKSSALAISLTIWLASLSVKWTRSWILFNSWPPLIFSNTR